MEFLRNIEAEDWIESTENQDKHFARLVFLSTMLATHRTPHSLYYIIKRYRRMKNGISSNFHFLQCRVFSLLCEHTFHHISASKFKHRERVSSWFYSIAFHWVLIERKIFTFYITRQRKISVGSDRWKLFKNFSLALWDSRQRSIVWRIFDIH